MLAPSVADVIFILLDETKGFTRFTSGKASGLSKSESRLKPELGLIVLPLNVYMHARLLPREEVEPEAAFTKNSRTHGRNNTHRGLEPNGARSADERSGSGTPDQWCPVADRGAIPALPGAGLFGGFSGTLHDGAPLE